MHIQLQKFYQIVLTGVGLCLFILVLALNHAHPHNEGIANLTRGSLFKRLGVESASGTRALGLSYVQPVQAVTPPKTDKMPDPTTPSQSQPASLPTVNQAGQNGDSSSVQTDSASTNQSNPQNANQDQANTVGPKGS